MIRYIGKRLLWMIPIVLGVSLMVFALIDLVPGDPASIILGASASQDQIDALNEAIGYYQPFWTKYFNYMSRLIRLDFGTSYATELSVFIIFGL